jgi:membrane associated rhomboid family serine protease
VKDEKFNFTALKLCAVFIGIYALQVFQGFEPGFNASTSPFWKFFTSIIGHSGPEHLFNNIFFIGLFGSILERLSSSRTLLATFLVSALFANLSAFVFFPETFIIGASGGGMGILAALAVYRPNKIGLALGVPLPMWAALAVYVFINVAGLTAVNNTAYEAHLLGMVIGAIAGVHLRDSLRERDEDDEDLEEENWRERIKDWEEKWMMNS